MSVVTFIIKNNKLEATADRYAYDHSKKIPYEKLFKISEMIVIGFASECMAKNTIEIYRLRSESAIRGIDDITKCAEILWRGVFDEDTELLRRPDRILIGGFDAKPRIFKLSREDSYSKVHKITDDHAFIGWVDKLEEIYQDKKGSSADIAIELLQDRCNIRPDLAIGVPRRYIVDKYGVQETILTEEIKPRNNNTTGKMS